MFPYEHSKTVSVRLSIPRVSVLLLEKNLSWLRQYQSYISNLYINGKVFMSTAAWKPKYLDFCWKSSNNFDCSYPECLYSEKRNHLGFVNISSTLEIDTSMERSLRVPTAAWKLKNLNFFSKKFEIEFWLVFWQGSYHRFNAIVSQLWFCHFELCL